MSDSIAMIFAKCETRHLPPGAYLFHTGDPVQWLHLIHSGEVSLERLQPGGNTTCFQRAGPMDVLAEASVYSTHYHCDARTLTEAQVRRIGKSEFLRALDDTPSLSRIWAAHLARTVQRTRLNAEIRSLKTVAERLDAWLDANGGLPAKGQWQSLANELSVSREALYRELARRRTSDHP